MLKLFLVILNVLILSGCRDQAMTYSFLVTHPHVLEREIDRCQVLLIAEADNCDVVRRAARDFSDLVRDRGANPEGFGKRILAAQTKLVETQQSLERATGDAKQALVKDYDLQHENLATMMAVVSATTGIE
jgi:hypothetical protein